MGKQHEASWLLLVAIRPSPAARVCGRRLNIVLRPPFLGVVLLAIGCSDKGRIAEEACPLVIPDECLQVGTIWSDSTVPLTLPITNTSGDAIRVNGVHTSCSCAVIDQRPFSLLPGESEDLKISLAAARSASGSLRTRRFSAPIVVSVGDPARHWVWTLRGEVSEAFELHPPTLQFADVLVGAGAGPRGEVLVRWHTSLVDVSIRSDVEWLSVTPRPTDGQARRRMDVSLARDLPIGSYEGAIVCSASTLQGEPVLARLPVQLGVIGDLRMTPASRHLGVVFPGEQIAATFQLVSRTGSEFTVRSWFIEPSEAVVVRYDCDSKVFTLSPTPRGDGLTTFALSIEAVDSGGERQEITEKFQYESVGATAAGE